MRTNEFKTKKFHYKGGVPNYNHSHFYRESPRQQSYIPFVDDEPCNKMIVIEIVAAIAFVTWIIIMANYFID